MIGLIIQARLGSTRLPQKMILPFNNGKGILELLIEKVKKSFSQYPIVLATSEKSNDDVIAEIGKAGGVTVFRGSEDNVLERFVQAAQENNITKIIRICADNPFLNIPALEKLIQEYQDSDVDYLAYSTTKGIPSIKTHFGFWAEGVSLSALKKVQDHTNDSLYLEHVTNFIYGINNSFKIKYLQIPEEIENSSIRLTVDTKEDFFVAQEIYKKTKEAGITELQEIINLAKNNKKWLMEMHTQIELNSK